MSSSCLTPESSALPALTLLPELVAALKQQRPVVVQAPNGAGKSTALPLALLQSGGLSGRIIMLEPRRLAARNIARFLAEQLGETVGQQVGYRVRGESRVSADTRLEIVTEGILTRMLQGDPELTGVELLIFDEFHERSLHADLALALSIESRGALRPDLKLLVMSATLEGLDFSTLLPDAELLRCEGRAHPLSYHYRGINRQQPLVPQCGAVVLEALAQESGSLLVFLPGAGEIERLARDRVLAQRADRARAAVAHAQAAVAAGEVLLGDHVDPAAAQDVDLRLRQDAGRAEVARRGRAVERLRVVVRVQRDAADLGRVGRAVGLDHAALVRAARDEGAEGDLRGRLLVHRGVDQVVGVVLVERARDGRGHRGRRGRLAHGSLRFSPFTRAGVVRGGGLGVSRPRRRRPFQPSA